VKTLILMQGIPGSGKSTIAEGIVAREFYEPRTSRIFSTDEFWGDLYEFDASRLGAAHAWNERRTFRAMVDGIETIIIDNTNIKARSVAPYVKMAKDHGYIVTVVRVDTPLEECLRRYAERPEARRVPEETVRRMYDEMEDLRDAI